jgi:hypothetical protein
MNAENHMTPAQIIRAAIPEADEVLCDHILWGRTPFPMGAITAQSLFKAANDPEGEMSLLEQIEAYSAVSS